MAINFKNALGVHQYTLGVRSIRAEVLATNIANADTPQYKAKDIDFKDTLEQQKRKLKFGVGLGRTHNKHFGSEPQSKFSVKYRTPLQPDTGDGNTVDMATERNHFVRNSMEYSATFKFLSSKFAGLKSAISGRSGG